MRESVIYQEILQEGIDEGIQKGRQEGRQEEALFFISSYLQRKFGALDPELHKQLQGLSVAQLEELVNVLFDFEKIDELKAWLQEMIS